MSRVGNIYTASKFDGSLYYNVVSNMNDIIADLPTLIIGWQNVKRLYPNADILNWKISDNLYWTFGKRENRSRYDSDTIKFKDICIQHLIDTEEYIFVDMVTANRTDKLNVLSFIKDTEKIKCAVLFQDMLYITEKFSHKTYGISLRDIDFIGKKSKDILNIVKSNKSIRFIPEELCYYTPEFLIKNKNYLLPELFS